MLGTCNGNLHRRTGIGVAAAAFATLMWVGSGHAFGWSTTDPAALPLLGDGLVAGALSAAALGMAALTWRQQAAGGLRWVGTTGALVAAQSLLLTVLALQSPARGIAGLAMLLVVALVGMLAVAMPLLALPSDERFPDVGVTVGLGLGLGAAGHVLLQLPIASSPPSLVHVIVAVLVTTHVAAVLVLRHWAVSSGVTVLLAATVLVVDAGPMAAAAGFGEPLGDGLLLVARSAVGAAWLAVAFGHLRSALVAERERADSIQDAIEEAVALTTRDQRERLHELRSTVAGLVTGSALIDNADLSTETRQHLWASVRRELGRMERLLTGDDGPTTDIDLDESLTLILELQRLKGRRIELRSNGDVVRGRYDALAEVLNILMDNAATHGGTDSSLIEVERRDDETVDITVTDFGCGIPEARRAQIFDWGERGASSPGEGIGLHLAQRLLTEDGGSLRLADEGGAGSSFVISLPAARRSPENEPTLEDSHGWRRSG